MTGVLFLVLFTEEENTRQLHVSWGRRMNLKSTLKLEIARRRVYKDSAYLHQWLVLGFQRLVLGFQWQLWQMSTSIEV